MPFVTFNADFDFSPRFGVTIAYKAGHALDVTTACMVAAGDRCTPRDRPHEIRNGINETIKSGRSKGNRRV
jgi:hypothetical protein